MRYRAGTSAVAIAVGLATLATACSQKRVDEDPVIEQGDRVSVESADREKGNARSEARREELATRREAIRSQALARCGEEACRAILSGEMALGLTETGVLAATGTTEEAWSVRRARGSVVMTPASLTRPPEDAVAELAMVQLRDGRVARYAYREASGVRLVDSREDATAEGRAEALARRLLEEGDELAAQGRFDAALDRYDRASVLTDDEPIVDYRIARVLDKQLRPIQALVQYRLFLHRLELERIEAQGEAAAKLADAIAQARQRIIVLEKKTGQAR